MTRADQPRIHTEVTLLASNNLSESKDFNRSPSRSASLICEITRSFGDRELFLVKVRPTNPHHPMDKKLGQLFLVS
jgi:hypothetical protein